MKISILILISDEDSDSKSLAENYPAIQKRKRRLEDSSDQDEDDLGTQFVKLVKESPNSALKVNNANQYININ